MVVGSVCLYLTVRKSSILKFPTQFNNLAMFLVPLVIYAFLGYVRQVNYNISLNDFLVIFVASVFFSYIASVTSLKSIELAPNPGYSLVISKSYVVFTTLVSFLFLDGEITIRKSVAIILIVLFSGLIAVDPKKTKEVKSKIWLAYTMYSFFGWGLLTLAIKYLSIHGLSTLTTITYVYALVSLLIVLEIWLKKVKFEVNKPSIFYFFAIGVFSSLFNYFNFHSLTIAPNVGYVNAINASSISIVTILSIVLFKDEFSYRKLFGVFGVTFGLLLLLL